MHTCKNQHTPEGCHVTWDRKGNVKDIELCPLHGSAPKLLKALQRIVHDADRATYLGEALNDARAAIQEAEGGEHAD